MGSPRKVYCTLAILFVAFVGSWDRLHGTYAYGAVNGTRFMALYQVVNGTWYCAIVCVQCGKWCHILGAVFYGKLCMVRYDKSGAWDMLHISSRHTLW